MVLFIRRIILISTVICVLLVLTFTAPPKDEDKSKKPLDPYAQTYVPTKSFSQNSELDPGTNVLIPYRTSIATPSYTIMGKNNIGIYAPVQNKRDGKQEESGSNSKDTNPDTSVSLRMTRGNRIKNFTNTRNERNGTLSAEQKILWDELRDKCQTQVNTAFQNIQGRKNLADYALINFNSEMVVAEYTRGFYDLFKDFLVSDQVPTPEQFCAQHYIGQAIIDCGIYIKTAFGKDSKEALYNAFYAYRLNQFSDTKYLYMQDIIATYSLQTSYNERDEKMPNVFEFCYNLTYEQVLKMSS